MKSISIILCIFICLTLTNCGIHQVTTPNEASDSNLISWIGEYSFFEFIKTEIGSDMSMNYEIIIYEDSGSYFANVIIDGFQTMTRVNALIRGNSNAIDLISVSYFSDNLYEKFNQGDILLTLARDGNEIITTWVNLKPILYDIENPGVYFIPNLTSFAEGGNEDIPIGQERMCEIESYLYEYLKYEFDNYRDWIHARSNGEAVLYLRVNPLITQGLDERYTGNFYTVYVGGSWFDRTGIDKTVNWDWFHVDEKLDMILWENIVTGDLLTLDEWRVSPFYRDEEFIAANNEASPTFNPFFFEEGVTGVVYEGFFYPLSLREIRQDTTLSIEKIETFDSGSLYILRINQIDVSQLDDPNPDGWDKISYGFENLGYFFVTENEIYKSHTRDEFSADERAMLIHSFNESVDDALLENNFVVVSSENGTEIINDDGWYSYVTVEGDTRIYHAHHEYHNQVTRHYERIVWEKGNGIVHYVTGIGAMRGHVEFGKDLYEIYPNRWFNGLWLLDEDN